MSPLSQRREPLLLRQRFDSFAQVREHLHVQEGRSLLYVRSSAVRAEGGDRALLDIAAAGQHMLLRGSVVSRDVSGFWLEVPDGRLARRLGAGQLAARQQRRLPMDLLIEVRNDTSRVGRLVDLSLGGARVAGVIGVPAGGQVSLRLLTPLPDVPSALGKADVVRAANGDLALRFPREDLAMRGVVLRLFEVAQKAWARAIELPHAPGCCGKSGVLHEPPMPRLRAPGSQS